MRAWCLLGSHGPQLRLHRWPRLVAPRRLRQHGSTLPRLPLFEAIKQHDPRSTAIVHSRSGRSYAYGQLLQDVADARQRLRTSEAGAEPRRIAFLAENSYDYVGERVIP